MEEYNSYVLTQESYEQENQSTKCCGLIRWKSVSKGLFALWTVTLVGFASTYLHMHGQLSHARTHHGNGEFDTRVDSHIGGFAAQQQSQISADTLDKRIKETSQCLPPSCTECATHIKAAPSDGYNPEYRDCSTGNQAVVNITCYNCHGKCAMLTREEVRSRMDNIHMLVQCPAPNVPASMSCCDVVRLCQLHDMCNGGECVCPGPRTRTVTCSCPAGRTGKYCTETAEKTKVKCKCFHSTLPFCNDGLPSCDVVSHGDPNKPACQMMVNATSRCLCDTSRQIDESSSLWNCSSMQIGVTKRLTSGAGIYKASVSLTAGLTNMYLMVFWLTHGLRTDI